LFMIDGRTKPIMIVQGDADRLVPREQSLALGNALSEARVPSFYIGYPGGHSFEGLTRDELRAILQLETGFIIAVHKPK
ncbi:MAG TPA: hypothetical protein VHU15_07435, partial [Stellaceae bacterium]|nr:hypothetical protein [Stellaceae bacterium]